MTKKRKVSGATPPPDSCAVEPQAFSVDAVRQLFPVFQREPNTIFFDNAATTQKPQTVIDVVSEFLAYECSNSARAAYARSTKLSARLEETRARVARFIGATPETVCFTSGATESLNLVALSWGLANLKSGDEIMLCLQDHKSTVLPWLNLQSTLKQFGIEINIVPIRLHHEGDYELKSIREALSDRTRLIAVSHVHHLFGLDMEIGEIRKIVGRKVLISLDASQSIGHRPVNVRRLNVDFLSFSGHKMFSSNGVGVLYVRKSLLGQLKPVIVGGGMTRAPGSEFSVSPQSAATLLEAGTQNIPAILSLGAALDFIESIGGLGVVDRRLSALTRSLYSKLKTLPGIDFSPGVDRCGCHRGFGIVSFRFEHVSTSDLAFLLESEDILVRTGDHCLTTVQDGDDYVRVSMHVYNSEAEIDRLIEVLRSNI